MKHKSKRMKHTELNAIEYAGLRSFSVSVLLSLVTTHAQAPTRRMHPTLSEAACAPIHCPASHAERALMCCPSPHAPHSERVAAHAPHVLPCRKDAGPAWLQLRALLFFSLVITRAEQCSRLTCKSHSRAHSVLAIGMEHFGTGPYRCTIPDFIIIIIIIYE
jgi:hypothetical protein